MLDVGVGVFGRVGLDGAICLNESHLSESWRCYSERCWQKR